MSPESATAIIVSILFIIAMTYLQKFRKVAFVMAGLAAGALGVIWAASMLTDASKERGPWEHYQPTNAPAMPPLPKGFTLDPVDPVAAPQKQSYERTSCCYRGYDLSKFGGAERRAIEDAIDNGNPFSDLIPAKSN